jgi:hypothetical protein
VRWATTTGPQPFQIFRVASGAVELGFNRTADLGCPVATATGFQTNATFSIIVADCTASIIFVTVFTSDALDHPFMLHIDFVK